MRWTAIEVRPKMRPLLLILLYVSLGSLREAQAAEVTIGSKKFTESVILGEIVHLRSLQLSLPTQHLRELGGTRILWGALLQGDIDIYPEYSGTLTREILADQEIASDSQLVNVLEEKGITVIGPLGFNNTYAIGMKDRLADSLGIRTISDLARFPHLKLGFGNEFIDRADGWPALRTRYQLPHLDVIGLDHDLAYRGLEQGSIQVMDLYSTDAEIEYYDLRMLQDDKKLFPEYQALFLMRTETAQRVPNLVRELQSLQGQIDEDWMTDMNAQVKIEKRKESQVARSFWMRHLGVDSMTVQGFLAPDRSAWETFWQRVREHLALVSVSLVASILLAVPLGTLAGKWKWLGQGILGISGVLQTIPSLALLVFMIPFFGIGTLPCIVALFIYSLLPIIRGTHTGITSIPVETREMMEALGLSAWQKFRNIEFPLALPNILAGVKTAAVINVGTATLGALIGAGGFGQPILTGIRLDDTQLILWGAIPAALLALLVQFLFDGLERIVVSPGLRIQRSDR